MYRDITLILLLSIGFTSSRVHKISLSLLIMRLVALTPVWHLPIEQWEQLYFNPLGSSVTSTASLVAPGMKVEEFVVVDVVTKPAVMWESSFLWTLSNMPSSEWRKFSLEWGVAPDWIREWLRKSLEEKIVRNYDLAHRYSKKVSPILPELSLYIFFWMQA